MNREMCIGSYSQLSILPGSLDPTGQNLRSLEEHTWPPITWPHSPQQFHLFLLFNIVRHSVWSTCCSPIIQFSLWYLVVPMNVLSWDMYPSPILSCYPPNSLRLFLGPFFPGSQLWLPSLVFLLGPFGDSLFFPRDKGGDLLQLLFQP
jgi:hypothetical protein